MEDDASGGVMLLQLTVGGGDVLGRCSPIILCILSLSDLNDAISLYTHKHTHLLSMLFLR